MFALIGEQHLSTILAFNTFRGSPCSYLACPHRTLLPSLPRMLELVWQPPALSVWGYGLFVVFN